MPELMVGHSWILTDQLIEEKVPIEPRAPVAAMTSCAKAKIGIPNIKVEMGQAWMFTVFVERIVLVTRDKAKTRIGTVGPVVDVDGYIRRVDEVRLCCRANAKEPNGYPGIVNPVGFADQTLLPEPDAVFDLQTD